MVISTKYSFGEEVHFLKNGKAASGRIVHIGTSSEPSGNDTSTTVFYKTDTDDKWMLSSHNESDCYSSKDALITAVAGCVMCERPVKQP